MLCLFSASASACKPVRVDVQKYIFSLDIEDVDLRKFLTVMVEDYNDAVGFRALSATKIKKLVTSDIQFYPRVSTFTQDASGEALGMGQHVYLKKPYNPIQNPRWEPSELVVEHSMSVLFEIDFIKSRIAKIGDKTSIEYRNLFQLFCHEIGHGLGFEHEQDKNSIMYYMLDVSGARGDFDHYFSRVIANFQR